MSSSSPSWARWMRGDASVSVQDWKNSNDPLEQAGWFWAWAASPMETRRQRCMPVDQAWAQRTAMGMVAQTELLAQGMAALASQQPDGILSIELFGQLVRNSPSFRSPALEALVWQAGEALCEKAAAAKELAVQATPQTVTADGDDEPALAVDDDPDYDDFDDEDFDNSPGDMASRQAERLLFQLQELYCRPTVPASPANVPFMRGLVCMRPMLPREEQWRGGNFRIVQGVGTDWSDPLLEKVKIIEGSLTLAEAERWLPRWLPMAPHPVQGFLENQVFIQQVNQASSKAQEPSSRRSRL